MSPDPVQAFAVAQDAVAQLRKVLDEEAWRLPESELVAMTRQAKVVESQLASAQLRLLREVDSRGIANTSGAVSLQSWLQGALRMSPQLARERVRVAATLRDSCAATDTALAQGQISYEQAKAVAFTVAGLPEQATTQARSKAEAYLLGYTHVLDAHDLRKLQRRINTVIDPDGSLPREERARQKRAANLRTNYDGTQTLSWRDTEENIAALKAAMTALDAPRPAEDGTKDPRMPAERRADAMVEIIRSALRHGELPRQRGERPHLLVTIKAGDLRTGTGFARTGSGEDLPAQAVRAMACDADLIAMILNDDGVPLSVGRTQRIVTPAQWVALVERDRGCTFPGCQRPPHMCIAHHIVHWIEGGPTDLDNLALLCGHHHDLIHHRGWHVEMGGNRHPHYRPPRWIDPDQRPATNPYWKTQKELQDLQLPGYQQSRAFRHTPQPGPRDRRCPGASPPGPPRGQGLPGPGTRGAPPPRYPGPRDSGLHPSSRSRQRPTVGPAATSQPGGGP